MSSWDIPSCQDIRLPGISPVSGTLLVLGTTLGHYPGHYLDILLTRMRMSLGQSLVPRTMPGHLDVRLTRLSPIPSTSCLTGAFLHAPGLTLGCWRSSSAASSKYSRSSWARTRGRSS